MPWITHLSKTFAPQRLLDTAFMKLSGLSPAPTTEEAAPDAVDLTPPKTRLPAIITDKRLTSRRRYPYGLHHTLLKLSPRDPFTIKDMLESITMFGMTGSGKTTGSGRKFSESILKAGFGVVVNTYKSDEGAFWQRLCSKNGRRRDLYILRPGGKYRCNLLEYILTRAGEGAGHVENAASLIIKLADLRNNGVQHAEPYWRDGAQRLMRTGIEALALGGELLTLDNLQAILHGLPFWDEGLHYPEDSLLKRCLEVADTRAAGGETLLVSPKKVRAYFEKEWAMPGAERQNAGVLSTLQTVLDPLQSQVIQDLLFSPTPNFSPEFCRHGAVIVLDLPVLEFETIGRTTQVLFKLIAQQAVMRRQGLPRGETPVAFYADEASNFVTPLDGKFVSASRSSWGCSINLVQNISALQTIMNASLYKPQADELLGNFGTLIFHRNGDTATNNWASESIGKGIVLRHSASVSWSESQQVGASYNESSGWSISSGEHNNSYSQSGNSGFGVNRSRSRSRSGSHSAQQTWDYLVPQRTFHFLRSGGREHKRLVDGIVFKAGKIWKSSGQPYLGVTFHQK